MLQLRSKETLDHGDLGWLMARHHFVVSANGNNANSAIGALVVWNDDEIAPGYRLWSSLPCRYGNRHQCPPRRGDARTKHRQCRPDHGWQRPGHEHLNRTQSFQAQSRAPSSSSRSGCFRATWRAGRLVELTSKDPKNADALLIRADARVLGATLLAGTSITHAPARFQHAYLAPRPGRDPRQRAAGCGR